MQVFMNRLVLPKVFEPIRRQFRVADSVRNVFVAEVMLNRPGVLAVIGKLVTRSVTEHVWMHWEPNPCRHSGPGDDLSNTGRCKRPFPFPSENVRGVRIISLQATKGSQLWSPDWMGA